MTNDERLERELKRAFANRATTPCPGEAALVAFYRGGLSDAESDAIRDHLGGCASCVELARDARTFVAAVSGAEIVAMGGPAVEVMPMPRAKRWLALAAALAAAAILGIFLSRSKPVAPMPVGTQPSPVAASNPWKDLAVAAAPYPASPEDELLYRSNEAEDADFRAAMLPYARGEYAAAEVSLAGFLASHPGDGPSSFFRGVSLLMLGEAEDAIPALASAVSSAKPPEDARWYLALARLKTGDASAAGRELEAVAAASGAHRLEAARLLEEIRSAGRR